MRGEEYFRIISIVRSHTGTNIYPYRECDRVLQVEFPNVSQNALASIYSNEFMKKMKGHHGKVKRRAKELYIKYTTLIKESPVRGVILRMSDELNTSPTLLARVIMEEHFEKCPHDCNFPPSRTNLTKMMKDSTLILNADLAYEVYLCTIHDDQYGPIPDCIKRCVGQEYEMKLQRMAKAAGLMFRSEEELRTRGFDKTPDIKLEVPVAVNGFIINWIESKALFGDDETHRGYLKDQYSCYWNRFGPGLIIYWFGFVDSIESYTENKFMIRDDFPSNITLMDPTVIGIHCKGMSK